MKLIKINEELSKIPFIPNTKVQTKSLKVLEMNILKIGLHSKYYAFFSTFKNTNYHTFKMF